MPDIYVPPFGPTPADLMVIAEAPAKNEIFYKPKPRPLVGSSGMELRNILSRFAHIDLDDTFRTNIFHTPLQKPESKITPEEWAVAMIEVREEIRMARPRVILALGAVAVHALLPETHGHDMETVNALPLPLYLNDPITPLITVIPSYHPAASFRDSSKLQYLIEACKAVKVALKSPFASPIEVATTQIRPLKSQLSGVGVYTALDTESERSGKPYLVSASSVVGEAAVVEAGDQEGLDAIGFRVARPDVITLLHNALYDLPVLEEMGILPYRWIDTMTLAFMLQHLPLSLKELHYKLHRRRMRTYEEVVGPHLDLRDAAEHGERDSVWAYSALDPDATLQIFHSLWPRRYPGLEAILERDMDVHPMVVQMMKTGMPVVKDHFIRMDEELEAKNFVLSLDIEQIAMEHGFTTPIKSGAAKGRYFNPRSGPQIADLLFNKLKLGKGKKIKKTGKGDRLSTSKKMTAKMVEEHKVVRLIDTYKATATLQSNFLRVLPKYTGDDGRIHADISMTRIPHSGRFAISKPNLMAIPVRSEDGRKIRNGFVAPDGWTFISSDLNQIELRILAHDSQDAEMLRIYRNHEDIHSATAMKAFGIRDITRLDDYKHRLPAKTTNFLICNLGTAQALSRELIVNGAGDSWTEDRCEDFIQTWFKSYPGVRLHLDDVAKFTLNMGYAVDLFGRRETIPQIYSDNKNTVEEGIRIASNQRIQSGAQGVMKEIMRNLWQQYGWKWAEMDMAYPVLQIHDDLVWMCRIEHVPTLLPIIKYWTENSVKLSIPVTSGVKVGPVWGSMEKYKK